MISLQETTKGPVRLIGFDKIYGIVYAELADGSFISADLVEPMLRIGVIKLNLVPALPVTQEYIVKEMVAGEGWRNIDEIFPDWPEAVLHLHKCLLFSEAVVRRGVKHAIRTGEPVLLNVSSAPAQGLLVG